MDQQLARLPELSGKELAALWLQLTATAPPRVSAALLRLALAYELQVRAYGGLSRKSQQALAQHARGLTKTASALPGMRLVREWNGEVHVVTVGDDQVIRWNDREWGSLSEVARAITGTRWSGPAFFGLKKKAA